MIRVELGKDSYDINIASNLLENIDKEINLDRKVMIVTDEGVPAKYSEKVKEKSKEGFIVTIKGGEDTKSLDSFALIQKRMLEEGFSRGDCVVAVGGGVIGDLAGFVAASYMRGVDFYNIPTTILSQVDSSIGGKTAVNFNGVKNIIGAFYQPKKVIIDKDVYKTLPDRQITNGLAEAIKMACTCNKELFEKFENEYNQDNIYDYIEEAILIKKMVVEEDVKEKGLRKVLNFGHTIGHGIEVSSDGKYLHGECVGLGMLLMCSNEVRERLVKVMNNIGLPIEGDYDVEKALEAISHDKKSNKDSISTVYVEKVGEFVFKDMTISEIENIIKSSK